MSETALNPVVLAQSVRAFCLVHRFRDGVYLGLNGRVRDFPHLSHAAQVCESMLASVDPLMRGDWCVATVEVKVWRGDGLPR